VSAKRIRLLKGGTFWAKLSQIEGDVGIGLFPIFFFRSNGLMEHDCVCVYIELYPSPAQVA
jgi:hypothetical protein